jgi:phosphatidylglycerol:prolipoprotein diacylglycerol transferase
MHPIICTIGPLTIFSYGLMLALAYIIATALMLQQAKKSNIEQDFIFNLSFFSFICGVLGARLFYVIENISYYLQNPFEIVMLQRGGLSWFGGLIAGVSFAVIYLKKKEMPVYKIFDLIAPFAALAHGIGRIGCLLNGCCFGKVSDFGIYSPSRDFILVPTQLYSSLLLILIFVILRFLQERPHKDGEIFFTYLLLYSAKRFFIEFWRDDNGRILLGLSLFQILSIALFILAVLKLASIKKKL